MILALHLQIPRNRQSASFLSRLSLSSSSSSSSSTTSSSTTGSTIRTLAPGSHVAEMEVKKSRFIGYATKAEHWDDAKHYIDQIKQEHPKARHWCYGFTCGYNPVQERSNDDGEPQGTAGAPILNAIHGEDLSNVVCVVVRYFGGIKLGAGGLIRAYGGAARLVLREAPVEETQPTASFQVTVDASHVGAIYENLAKAQALPSQEEYRADGTFVVTVTCEVSSKEDLQAVLSDATKGSAEFSE